MSHLKVVHSLKHETESEPADYYNVKVYTKWGFLRDELMLSIEIEGVTYAMRVNLGSVPKHIPPEALADFVVALRLDAQRELQHCPSMFAFNVRVAKYKERLEKFLESQPKKNEPTNFFETEKYIGTGPNLTLWSARLIVANTLYKATVAFLTALLLLVMATPIGLAIALLLKWIPGLV